MNRTYRVIRNQTGILAVASEIARGRTKGTRSKLLAAILAVAGADLALESKSAYAGYAAGTDASAANTHDTAVGDNAVADSGEATDDYAAAFGYLAKAYGAGSMAFGSGATAGSVDDKGTALYAMAFGAKASALGQDAIALGREASASDEYTISIGSKASATASGSTSIGMQAESGGTDAVAMGTYANAAGQSGVAIGYRSSVTGVNAVALGATASASGSYGVALGHSASASGNYGVALGDSASASGISDVALGDAARASGGSAVAIGDGARASGSSAIALGASAVASGVSGVALGLNASVASNATRAVALGTMSIADRGPISSVRDPLSYSGASVTTELGEVSVGSDNQKRQITNVAAGTQTNDAANVGQVSAVKTVVDANATATVAALGGGSTVGSDGKISAPSYTIGGSTFNNVGGALSDLDGRVTDSRAAIDEAQSQLNTLDGVAAKYDGTTKSTMTLGGTNGTKLTNLQDATLSATSTDAVTGRQLNATNTRMTTAEGNIDNLKTQLSNISGGTAGLVQQDATTKNLSVGKDTGGTEVSFAGKDADNNATKRKLTDVADGTNANDAVNFGQLSSVKTTVDQNTADIATNKANITATANAIVDSLGGGAAVNTDGTFTAPSYTVGSQTFNNVGGALGNLDGRVTTNTSDIAEIKSSMSSGGGGSDGLVQQEADSKDVNVAKNTGGNKVNLAGTDGDRVLAGVADGAISASSNQAVNGKQLYSISSSVASALGGGAGINADGTFRAPLFNIGGSQLNNVGDALKNLDDRVANNTNDINTLKNSGGGGNGGGSIKNGVQYDTDTHDSMTLNSGGDAVSVKNVKNGTVAKNSTDAVNGGQLWETNEAVKNLDQKVTNNQTTGNSNVSIKASPNLKAASASGDGSVAMGGGSVASGDRSTALGENSVASGENSVALGHGSVADEKETVSVGSDGNERRITNVRAGKRSTDAVNMGQLNQLRNDMNGAINSVARAAYSGIASAMAMPNLTPSGPGKTIVAAGGANYKGYSAVAASATYRSRNGRLLVNGAISVAQTGDAGFRAQVGYEF